MARGRPPKPTEVKRDTGNPGGRELEPVVVGLGKALEFPAPANLSAHEADIWGALVPEVAAAGWLDKLDRAMLVMLVQTIALAEEARAAVAEHGYMLTERRLDKDGNAVSESLKVNPAARAQIQATGQALRLAEQFGLTPSARARLGLNVARGMSLAAELEQRIGSPEIPDTIEVEATEVEDAEVVE